MKPLLILTIILISAAIVFGALSFMLLPKMFMKTLQDYASCTQEAMLCPDGSAVGRTKPNCEFAKCPEIQENTNGITGSVLLGPTCPVEKYPPDEECADKPYATKLVVTTKDGAQVIKEFESDENGMFKVNLPHGEYAIRSAAAANILPYCSSNEFTVTANAYTEVLVSCDTGIR